MGPLLLKEIILFNSFIVISSTAALAGGCNGISNSVDMRSANIHAVGASTMASLRPYFEDNFTFYEEISVGGASDFEVFARVGFVDILVYPLEIPAVGSVVVTVSSPNFGSNFPALKGHLGGISGTLSFSGLAFVFTRDEPGESVALAGVTRFTPISPDYKKNDWLVINIGKNEARRGSSSADIVKSAVDFIEWSGISKSNVIVIGLFKNTGTNEKNKEVKVIDEVNTILLKEFGDNFIDVSSYLVGNEVWSDLNIRPSDEDIIEQKAGNKPPSLSRTTDLKVDIHHTSAQFNEAFFNKFLSCRFMEK